MLPSDTRSLLNRLALPELNDAVLDSAWQSYSEQTQESSISPSTAGFLRFLQSQQLLSAEQVTELNAQLAESSVLLDTEQLLEWTQADFGLDPSLIRIPEQDQFKADLTLLNDEHNVTLADILPVEGAETEHSRPLMPLSEIARYQMLASVGQGAMGEVLLARDQFLHRQVAYKQILSNQAVGRAVISRFVKEAQITSQLTHPNIIPIYHLEVSADGKVAYSMKLIRGQDLKQVLADTRQQYETQGHPDAEHSLDTLLEHFLKVCEAMHYSHRKGVIHRDLKPANIMIGPYGEVYVMDWGIARLIGAPMLDEAQQANSHDLAELLREAPDPDQTRAGQILGTPRYMSPQQAAGRNDTLDGRSDLFALGLILFEIVTLKPAFTAREPMELLKQVLKAQKQPCTHLFNTKIPDELRAIIDKATGRKPDDRYPDVAAFADDLRRFRRGEAVTARPDNLWQRSTRWMSLHQRTTIMILLSVFLLCAGAIGLSLWREHRLLAENILHEQELQALTSRLAQLGQQQDSRLIRIEGLLDALADVTITALSGSLKPESRYYLHDRFHPPDLAYSQRYQKSVSVDWPVFKLAPGLSETQVAPVLRQLAPLRREFRQIFLKSALSGQLPTAPEVRRRLIAETGVPLVWAYIGLETGIMYAYPGKATYSADYDPRLRPWYKQALGHFGPHWGKAYQDIQGQGTLLPITRTLYSYQGQLLGVAGLEIPLSSLSENLTLPQQPGLKGLYLVDAQGQLLTQGPASAPPDRALLAQAASRKDSGYFETSTAIIAYTHLQNLSAILVAHIDRSELLARSVQPEPAGQP